MKNMNHLPNGLFTKTKSGIAKNMDISFTYASDGGASIAGKPIMAKPLQPPIPDTHIPMGWAKIFVIRQIMQKYPEVEWIFNTDCDVMITNMETKLEDIIKEHAPPNVHIIIPADCNGINCGNMLISNNAIGKAFIKYYYCRYAGVQKLVLVSKINSFKIYLWELTLKRNGYDSWWYIMGKCWEVILPQRVMNSYDYSDLPRLKNRAEHKDILGTDGQWKDGDFLIQWPATDLDYRIKAAKETHNKLAACPVAQQS
jgi:hypothetical protein